MFKLQVKIIKLEQHWPDRLFRERQNDLSIMLVFQRQDVFPSFSDFIHGFSDFIQVETYTHDYRCYNIKMYFRFYCVRRLTKSIMLVFQRQDVFR